MHVFGSPEIANLFVNVVECYELYFTLHASVSMIFVYPWQSVARNMFSRLDDSVTQIVNTRFG